MRELTVLGPRREKEKASLDRIKVTSCRLIILAKMNRLLTYLLTILPVIITFLLTARKFYSGYLTIYNAVKRVF